MRVFYSIWLISKRDLIIELRTKEIVLPVALFCIVLLILFIFTISPSSLEAVNLFPSLYFTTILLGGILALQKSIERERQDESLYGLIMAPCDLYVIYLGKALSSFLFVSLIGLVALPIFIGFLGLSLTIVQFLQIVFTDILFLLGFSFLGTLFTFLSWDIKAQQVMLPVLMYPLLIPSLLSASYLVRQALNGQYNLASGWANLLIGFDLLFVAISILTFDFIIEE